MATLARKVCVNFTLKCNYRSRHVSNYLYKHAVCSQSTATSSELQALDEHDLYPQIKPPYPPGKWGDIEKQKAWQLHDMSEELKGIQNAKERLEKLAGSEDIGLNRILSDDKYPNTLEFKQYVTKTHLIRGLPNLYDHIDVDKLLDENKSLISDAFLEEYEIQRLNKTVTKNSSIHDHVVGQSRWMVCHNLLGKVLNKLLISISPAQDHLLRAQVDENVRVETFWRRRGFNFHPPRIPLPGSLFFQHKSKVNWQVRTDLPLPEFIDPDNDVCQKGEYPDLTDMHPKYYGASYMKDRPISMSGHWIGDPCEFVQLGIHCQSSSYEWYVDRYGEAAAKEQRFITSLTSSFGSCVAQAHNQGFNWLMDITYPITTQTAFTDGKSIIFAVYQLNTLELWKSDEAVPVRNICWISDEQPLYEKLENGIVHGLNTSAFKQLLKMMVLQPEDRDVNLRPYLEETAPKDKHVYINKLGDPPLEIPKIGRFQYPRNAVYF